jgi:SAM-dependent methyltransferase
MDRMTVAAYDADAEAFAEDWHAQPVPTDLHALVRRYFRPGLTADIGCGSGREAAWLASEGYEARGYDPSSGLLREARARYPRLVFESAALPDLLGLRDDSFDNVLCETVLMHLPTEQIPAAVTRLLAVLKPGGTLYLSWRITEPADRRDVQGRLYAAFDASLVRAALKGAALLRDEAVISPSSGKDIHRLVARKTNVV